MSKIKRWLGFVLLAGLALLPFGIGDFGGVNGGPIQPLTSLFWLLGVLLFFVAFRWMVRSAGLTSVGLSRSPGWQRNLLIGMVYGLICIGAAIWAKVKLGQFHLAALPWHQVVTAAGAVLLATLFIALSEELVFRGYLVRILDGQPRWLVAVVSALGFVALHLPHWGSSWEYWLSLFFKGLFYVIPVLVTRSLWFGVGHHWTWNFGYFMLFGGVVGVTATPVAGYNPLADFVYLGVSALMALSAPLISLLLVRQSPSGGTHS